MKKVIIAIHGLGNKPAPELLKKWWLSAIREGLEKHIGPAIKLPPFEMVYWADVLNEKPLDNTIADKENPFYLDEVYVPSKGNIRREEHTTRKKILDFINAQLEKVFLNEDFTINYSSLTDKIIHKYFKELDAYYLKTCMDKNHTSCQVKDILRNRLREIIIQHKNEKILLIGHSMGSIISYDVLSGLPENITIDTFITIGSPLGMPIIKSKIASEFSDSIKTAKLVVPASIKKFWYNLSDVEDMVALNYKLADDFAPNSRGVSIIDFETDNDYEMNGVRNPHKSYGYLRSSEFSAILNNFIGKEKIPWYKQFISLITRLFNRN